MTMVKDVLPGEFYASGNYVYEILSMPERLSGLMWRDDGWSVLVQCLRTGEEVEFFEADKYLNYGPQLEHLVQSGQ